jgi:hypothetical protein
MQTLKIEIPAGFEFDSFDPGSQQLKLRPKKGPVTDIKTVEALLAYHGKTREGFEAESTQFLPHEKAFRLLDLLARTLNEGWVPDWRNSNEAKWYAWFDMGGSAGFRFLVCDDWVSGSGVGSRLCFKTKQLAEHAGRNFLDVYEQFMVLK